MAGDIPNGETANAPADVAAPSGEEKATSVSDVEACVPEKAKAEVVAVKRTHGGEPADEINVPEMSYLQLIAIFLRFGFSAFGGPVQQIAMMKEELVDKEKWCTPRRFQRVFGVYQALPGPEATELACYFGLIAKGYLGGMISGLCFILPGFCIMLLFAFLYTRFALFDNPGFLASFYGIRPCVPAFALKATIKLSENALMDHTSHPPTESTLLSLLGLAAFLTTVFHTPFFATLGFVGATNMLHQWGASRGPILKWLGFAFLFSGIGANVAYMGATNTRPGVQSLTAGLRTDNSDHGALGSLFVTGLLAGLVTFGGAFTAVPYVYRSLVVVGKQLTEGQFLDGIAIVNVVPTPLVMFITWDGFVAGGIAGAVVMTIGIFLPCFSFTFMHRLFMWLTENPHFAAFIDGVSAGVMGIIAETVCQLTVAAIHTGMDTLVFTICCGYIFTSKNKNAPVVVLMVAALAGQILYEKNSGNHYEAKTSASLNKQQAPMALLADALGFPPAPL